MMAQANALVGGNVPGSEQWTFERWFTPNEQRLADGLGLEDEWIEQDFTELRADVERLFPEDAGWGARVERFIVGASRKPEIEVADGPAPAPAISEDETVEPFRVMPSRPVDVADEPVTEPVEVEPDAPVIPPVALDVEEAAWSLAVQVWVSGPVFCEALYEGRQAHFVDQYLAHAASMGWLVDDVDRVVKGECDPRPEVVTAIPN
jgi:hypothetical protein